MKVVLSIEKSVLDKAKAYAKANKISLSKVIENYLAGLTIEKSNAPITESLSGILKNGLKQHSVIKRTRGILKDHYEDKSHKEIRDEMYKDKYGI